GPSAVRELTLPPAACVRWIWARRPASYCPTDVAPVSHAMALDEAVARSVNALTARHALLLPLLLWQRRPDLLHDVSASISVEERAALDSPADRALAADLFAQRGETVAPGDVASD